MQKDQSLSIGVSTQRPPGVTKPSLSLWRQVWKHRFLFLLALPGILTLLVFSYGPMPGLLIAFQDFSVVKGFGGSPWVGLEHFSRLFSDPKFWTIMRNTVILSSLNLAFLFPAPIILALLLNEITNPFFKRVMQTVYYLPHFLSWVIVASLTFFFFSSEIGVINRMIVSLGGDKVPFLLRDGYFYPIILLQGAWKEIGWGTIIYLAAIAGVSPTLYEAAKVDGASRWQQIVHITIPGIMPTVVVLFILDCGSILTVNFEQVWLMQNPLNLRLSEVIDTFVYKTGVQGGDFSYTTAVGLFKSVIGFTMVFTANWLANRSGQNGLW